MAQRVVTALRKREVGLAKKPRFETRRGDGRGNGCGAHPSFHRGADRFIGRHFQSDAEVVGRKAESLKRMFKARSGAGARLAQHPVDVQQILLA